MAARRERWQWRADALRSAGAVVAAASSLAGPIGLLVAVVLIVEAIGQAGLRDMGITMVINVILVVGLYVFSGTSGVMSFGHMSFMAIGAYLSGLLTIAVERKDAILPDLPGFLASASFSPVPATLIAAAVAAGVAFMVGVPIMRLSGLGAAIATLALLQISFIVAKNWEAVTGPTGATFGVPTTTTLLGALVWAITVIVVAYVFQESRTGLRLRASREEESAASSVGVNIWRERVVAFTLGAAIVGVGGALFAHFLGAFSPNSFYLGTTFITLAMLVIGGMTSLFGAVVGVVSVSIVSEGLLRIEGATSIRSLREIGLAVIMLMILLVRPRGITGGKEFRLRWTPRRADAGVDTGSSGGP